MTKGYQNYKQSRERRQKFAPLIFGGLAIILVFVGALLIFLAVRGTTSNPFARATETFTPTVTPSPTVTPTITLTPTATMTATIAVTPTDTLEPTPDAPFAYTVESGETVVSIADKFGVEYVAIMLMNNMTADTILYVGDELIIPNPGMGIPTSTPLAPNLPRGSRIEYFVLPGDSLQLIAEEFLSTVDDIVEENELEDANSIYPGQILVIPYYIITPTFGPTETTVPTETPTPPPAETTAPADTLTPTPTFTSTPEG